MVKIREPKSEKEIKVLQDVENKFIDGTEKVSLTDLSLDELATRFNQIDSQAQLLKGSILLEARKRFKSNNEFGRWVADVGLSADSRQNRNLFMNLARFFVGRDMEGISLTAAYEISRPDNADVAEKIYEEVLNKNLSVSEIKQKIEIAKSIPSIDVPIIAEEAPEKSEYEITTSSDIETDVLDIEIEIVENPIKSIEQILFHLDSLNLDLTEQIDALEKCLKLLNEKLDAETKV